MAKGFIKAWLDARKSELLEDENADKWKEFYGYLTSMASKLFGLQEFPELHIISSAEPVNAYVHLRGEHHIVIDHRTINLINSIVDSVSQHPNRYCNLMSCCCEQLIHQFKARGHWRICLPLFALRDLYGKEDEELVQRDMEAAYEEFRKVMYNKDPDRYGYDENAFYRVQVAFIQGYEDHLIEKSNIRNSKSMRIFQKAFIIAHELAHYIYEHHPDWDELPDELKDYESVLCFLDDRPGFKESTLLWKCPLFNLRTEPNGSDRVDLVLGVYNKAFQVLPTACEEARVDIIALQLVKHCRDFFLKGMTVLPVDETNPWNDSDLGIKECIYDSYLHCVLVFKLFRIIQGFSGATESGYEYFTEDLQSNLLGAHIESYFRYYYSSMVFEDSLFDGKTFEEATFVDPPPGYQHREEIAAIHRQIADKIISAMISSTIGTSGQLIGELDNLTEERAQAILATLEQPGSAQLSEDDRILMDQIRERVYELMQEPK